MKRVHDVEEHRDAVTRAVRDGDFGFLEGSKAIYQSASDDEQACLSYLMLDITF
jgi:hypothetical protein